MPKLNSLSQLRRRPPSKNPASRIAIICEGEKTEYLYFSALIGRLRPANVEIKVLDRECGSDPLSIVRFAKGVMKEDRGWDYCFCVIDRDTHTNFVQAVQEAQDYNQSIGEKRVFETVKSYPCFEYWLILHYRYTRAPFVREGNNSAGDCAVRMLKGIKNDYNKSSKGFMERSLTDLTAAISNSERSLSAALAEGEFNPSTEVHKLVLRLNETCGGGLLTATEEGNQRV